MIDPSRLFAELYVADADDRKPFGDRWCGPAAFEPWKTTLIAHYPKTSRDGHAVDVYCDAGPARFYLVVARDGLNSVGAPNKGFALATGSGADSARLVAAIAAAASGGMLRGTDAVPPPEAAGDAKGANPDGVS